MNPRVVPDAAPTHVTGPHRSPVDLVEPVVSHLGEMQPIGCTYVGPDQVRITLRNQDGEAVAFTMKSAMLVSMTNMSVALINNFTAQIFRDLDVF